MKNFIAISLLLGLALSEKIPLKRKLPKLQNFLREKELRATGQNLEVNQYGEVIPIKDYMNT